MQPTNVPQKEPRRHRLWAARVSRVGFTVTRHSRLCQDHFEGSAFMRDPHVYKSVGYKPGQLRLKPDAVPSIFEKRDPPATETRERRSLAFAKRRNLEVTIAQARGRPCRLY